MFKIGKVLNFVEDRSIFLYCPFVIVYRKLTSKTQCVNNLY